ncbi:MAG TPA: hypothetical protein VG167_01925 [Verrucomicrobiae bacterium]|nr:hypothetical protein [Verrucomicrobiae bacterium]
MKHFVLAFLLALVFYAVFYEAIESARTRKGPWVVTFTTSTSSNVPTLVISQYRLAITNVQICFPEQQAPSSNALGTMIFAQPQPVPFPVPFGRCVFMDTTFLPGTVSFQLYGHEVELLPRVLFIDRQERPWLSDSEITLHPK